MRVTQNLARYGIIWHKLILITSQRFCDDHHCFILPRNQSGSVPGVIMPNGTPEDFSKNSLPGDKHMLTEKNCVRTEVNPLPFASYPCTHIQNNTRSYT